MFGSVNFFKMYHVISILIENLIISKLLFSKIFKTIPNINSAEMLNY